jgi:DNA-binding NtrC family response regulator
VLVVDDDAAWRAAVKTWLEADGFRVVMLGRADWVAHAVEFHHPDVVVLDIHLPGANGLDVLDTVGRRWPTLPVIIMTAFGGPAVGDTARRRGAVGYLEKPFRMTRLVHEIRRVARA